jgi:hypothetical protein
MNSFKIVSLILLCFCLALSVNGETFKRVEPQLTVFEPDGSHIFFAPDVPVSTVKLLAKIPLEQLKSASYPSIYKMPHGTNLYLVAVSRNQETESEYVLFKEENNRLIEVKRTATIENTIVNTTFFVGKKKVLIVADTAVPPDFTGLEIFDYSNDNLSHSGNLSVAVKDKPTGLHGDFISPAPQMRVEYKSGSYRLTMNGNLYSDWGGEPKEEKKISSTATYIYNGKTFELQRKKSKR